MVTPDEVASLLRRHVLWPDETLERVTDLGDGSVGAETTFRRFVVDSQRESWQVGRAAGVLDVVVATRLDLLLHGQQERFAVVRLDGGPEVYANDPEALARFGARLPDDLAPLAFAELLVQFHPYSSATRAVLVEADDLRRGYGRDDLPDVPPMTVEHDADGLTMRFCSSIGYRAPAAGRLVDVAAWTVHVPTGGPATWTSHLVRERISLELVNHDG